MNTYADKSQKNKSQSAANTFSQKRRSDESTFQFVDNRPEAIAQRKLQETITNNPREIAQRKKIDSIFRPVSEETPAQQHEFDDLLSRGKRGKLKDGEVELIHQPEVGPMNLADLEQSLKSVRNPSAMPVADALDSKSASIRDGKVQMKGIDGSSDPTAIAQQVGQLRPQKTRIQRTSNNRFELQAKLNPWVSVLTGRSLPELGTPQQEPLDDETPHPIYPEVVWRNEPGEVAPLQEYGNEDTYPVFMDYLTEIDNSDRDPEEKQQAKAQALSEFHHHLKTLSLSEIQSFGKQLEANINKHEQGDSLDRAFDEDRAIYRSWHQPGRISESAVLGATVDGGQELVGADSLNVALNPDRFRNHKNLTKEPNSELVPLGAVPSSLLYHDQNNTVFNKDRGTATALLPENLYAGFHAYNETVKWLRRENLLGNNEGEQLNEHAKFMRAFVTRPVFFDNDDIQSSTGAFNHPQKDPPNKPHVRKIHSALHIDQNPLRESLDLKLTDPLRINALFYQTFSQHSKSDPYQEQWNEMVVKYRSTGHTAGLHTNIREWVPGLEPHQEIDDKLINSGKFSSEKAKEGKFVEPLVGTKFDPTKKTKKKMKR